MGCTLANMAIAQGAARVRQIVVEGTQRIEQETVRSYMSLAPGDPYSQDLIDKSLKSLFATGLFADVAIRQQGDTIVVRVVENPIINRLAFEGNKRISSEALQAEVQLRPRVVYTRTKVQNDVKRVLDLYRRQGRFAATVEPKVIQLEQNRVDLVFEIEEGPATYVKQINFIGNQAFTDSRLQETLATKEERWYRFLSSDDTYDPDRVTYDRELLRRFYLSRGYVDFKVISAVAELTTDRTGFFVTFTIEEGQRYNFGKIAVNSNLKNLKTETLTELISTQSNSTYNADEVEATIQRLTDDLAYQIDEGPRVYVERIDITGNVRTLDKVIRREFRIVEGDAFNAAKLRRSQQRIKDLNFFEKVQISNTPSDGAPDRTIIKADVEEKSTGELSFGVGYSTTAGPLAEVSVRERNLLGRGQDVKVGGSLGTRRTQVDFSFTEPYFLDRPLSAGFDVFNITRKLQRESSFDSSSLGTNLRTGFNYNERWRQDLKYTLRRDQVDNVATSASRFIREQAGTFVQSSIGQTLTYDRRDSRVEPHEGYFLRLNNDLAGFGGTENFLRTNVSGGKYWPVDDEVTLALTGTTGYIVGIGDEVRIIDRYFVGGDTLRGFASAGVSPRDTGSNKDALGGLWMYSATTQLNFPLGLPKEYNFTGQVFGDVGSVGATDSKVDKSQINQSSSIRASVGVGVTWRSPMGPLSVDLAVPLKKESFDEEEFFRFNFGTRF